MDPRYKKLAVAIVPQPREVPLPPFDHDILQALFSEVGKDFPYQSFEYIVNRRGAKFSNAEDDFVELRPAQLQISAKMDGPDVLTTEMAASKAIRILQAAIDQLGIPGFLQCAVQVIAVVPVPESSPDAKAFLADRLMGGVNVGALGDDYFGSTVRLQRLNDDPPEQDSLTVEPFFQDTSFIFLDHQIMRTAGGRPLTDIDQVDTWVGEAFDFVNRPVMQLLDEQGD